MRRVVDGGAHAAPSGRVWGCAEGRPVGGGGWTVLEADGGEWHLR